MSSEPISPPAPEFAPRDTQPPHGTSESTEANAGDRGVDVGNDQAQETPAPEDTAAPKCLNCDAELHGRYCAQCGQDAHHHVLSIRHTLGELLEDIAHADGKVWRTLHLLALKPGELTCEYLRGKRASYTPPFRLYVALSLLLFLVALLPDGSDAGKKTIVQGTQEVGLTQEAAEALDEGLEAVPEERRANVRAQLLKAVAKVPAESQVLAITKLAAACGKNPLSEAVLNTGVASGLAPDKLIANCKMVAKPAEKLIDAGSDHAPKMMVFFLPLIAAFGKLLYAGSRRYYVGHLVFFVHFHAFVFLAMASGNLAGSLAGLTGLGWLDTLSDLAVLALIFWVPVYLYKAMRHVYGQSKAVTRTKFVLLGFGYLLSFGLSAALLAIFVSMQVDTSQIDWGEIFKYKIE